MMRSFCCTMITIFFLVAVGIAPGNADPLAITPFYSSNQSPLVQIYGLPWAESALIQPSGRTWGLLALEVANNFASQHNSREEITLDGESARVTLALRHGISDRLELGMDLPLIDYNGGIFDRFIEQWHSFFGLPKGKRSDAPRDRLLFSYERDGRQRLRMEESDIGIGDIRLSSGWQLYQSGSSNPLAVALRASLKLPTGSSARLHGSGSTDIALWLTGSDDHLLPGSWGHLTLFLAGGGMAMTEGKVLKEQQRNLVGFGSLGFGWSPAEWLALKAQFSSHTPFYQGSDLSELGDLAVQLLIGGTCAFTSRTALDIAVSEDISVGTSPDVALHLGLSHQF
jgi:hypothetical protein